MIHQITGTWCLLALTLTLSTASAVPDQAHAKRAIPRQPPLGSFNFDFKRLGKTEAEQIKELQKIGYPGMTMRVNSAEEIQAFNRYRKAIQNTGFKLYAGFIVAKLGKGPMIWHPQLGSILKLLKALSSIHYTGPVILHTYGQKQERDHEYEMGISLSLLGTEFPPDVFIVELL